MQGFIIQKVHITEKASHVQGGNVYVFIVEKEANKSEIKKAIKKVYGVDAEAVRTLRGTSHAKRFRGVSSGGSDYKKAIVTLKKGQTIKLV